MGWRGDPVEFVRSRVFAEATLLDWTD